MLQKLKQKQIQTTIVLEILTDNIKCINTWNATKPTNTQSIHSGNSALFNLTEKKIVTTTKKMKEKFYRTTAVNVPRSY